MILIADSGSTKTDWRLVSNHNIDSYNTVGLNPFYQTTASIVKELNDNLRPSIKGDVEQVFFYGTGCAGIEACETVRKALATVFESATHLSVESDMLGAARAACGRSRGIACILGTGSNSALVHNGELVFQVPTLGFWLGDEGSGGYLGKTLVINYLQNELPDDLQHKFKATYNLSRLEVLENAYKKPFPNRYFAKFSVFLSQHLSHPYVSQFLTDAFGVFFVKYICKYPDYQSLTVNFVGSIAHHYQAFIYAAAAPLGISIGNITQSPIDALVTYHT
jgi:glucosamine kinase